MPDTPPITLESIEKEFGPKFDKLNERFDEGAEKLETARKAQDSDAVEQVTKSLGDLDTEVKALTKEREDRLRAAEYESVKGQVASLKDTLEKARQPSGEFMLGGVPADAGTSDDSPYGGDSEYSFYGDAKAVLDGTSPAARERWEAGMASKAMTEGTGTAGGFLVPPQVSAELLELREQDAILRPLFSSVNVTSDTLRIASVESGLVAGWVAELAEKPVADLSFAEISVNTFTAAGMAVASNQLLRDGSPSVDSLINNDLARRLRAVEEVAFIGGSGTGQPLGIINTAGVNAQTYTDASPTVPELLDYILDAITDVYENFFAAPDAIVMHPRTWAYIVKARESASPTTYIVGPPSGVGRRANEPIPGRNGSPGELFGVPVYLTSNIPTNLGAGTDESRVLVGNFKEGLVLDHEGITLDQSKHVYFTTNQTIFRAEEQVGFTAARYPRAFAVVGGTGLKAL